MAWRRRGKAVPRRGARELARLAIRLCRAGMLLRVSGRCAAADGSERRHRRLGHDLGCETLGIPLHSLGPALSRWNTVGAAGLLCEALGEAARDIAAAHADPSRGIDPERDFEAVLYAVQSRLTPAPETEEGRGP